MLTIDRLHEALTYDPLTGEFRWKQVTSPRCRVGAVAGSDNGKGYRLIRLDGVAYKAHRLAWLYMTGEWPEMQIDHANGDRADNRWRNLREATNSQNQANKRGCRSNTGHKGVTWLPAKGVFRAQIKKDGRSRWLGQFRSAQEAAAAYDEAARKLFGQFAAA